MLKFCGLCEDEEDMVMMILDFGEMFIGFFNDVLDLLKIEVGKLSIIFI